MLQTYSIDVGNEKVAIDVEEMLKTFIQKDNNDEYAEIRKIKGLLDDGIIIEERFTTKKKQLLGILKLPCSNSVFKATSRETITLNI